MSDGRLLSSAKTDVLTTENTEMHGKKLSAGCVASVYLLAARYEKEAIPIHAVPFCAFVVSGSWAVNSAMAGMVRGKVGLTDEFGRLLVADRWKAMLHPFYTVHLFVKYSDYDVRVAL